MNSLLVKVAMAVMASSLLYSTPATTQESATTKKVARVRITQGPEVESKETWAIIRWTSDNPGGSDEHFGVVHYSTGICRNLKELDQTAKSHIRLNHNHCYTIFHVPRGRPFAADDVLLHSRLDGGQWHERWSKEHRQPFHHTLMAAKIEGASRAGV
jgi:hypothetical protein